MFDRPNRRDRRLEEIVALCASRSSLAGGYTPAEHATAMDCLLDDLGVVADAPTNSPTESRIDEPGKQIDPPEIMVNPIYTEDEDDSRLFLTLAC